MTYPHAEVEALLEERFVGLPVDTVKLRDWERPLVREYRLLWTPGFVFLRPDGRELAREVGYLPPAHFLTVLEMALGKTALHRGRPGDALPWFERAAYRGTDRRQEALYWCGVARYYQQGRSIEALRAAWAPLERYPDSSSWAARADAFGVTPTGRRTGEGS